MESNGVRLNVLSESDELGFKKTNFSISIDWQEGPEQGESHFILRSWDRNLGTLSGPYQDLPGNLSIRLWMPSMGHGSSPVEIKKLDSGEYDVSKVYFIMKGAWELRLELKKDGQVVDEIIVPISI